MSVIIRLQNLPWTANARDIRNFFTGLSIPEGGVHIIGGEMGDAFIAFSTDEDARCAMLKDREKLMEIQVRLLLSSRAEMQKVIETARKVSVAAAAAAAAAATAAAATPTTVAAAVMPPVPQPPIIGSFISQLQQQVQLKQQHSPVLAAAASVATSAATVPSFLAYQQQAGITLADVATDRSRSRSSSSDDSRDSRDNRNIRDRDRDQRDHHHRDQRGLRKRRDSGERDLKMPPAKTQLSPWAIAPAAVAAVAPVQQQQQQLGMMSVLPPGLQSYSSSSTTTNNYNLNLAAAPQLQLQQQQQQLAELSAEQQQQQQPIAFANVNPYAQMYPQLFQQQQQLLLQQQAAKAAAALSNSPGGNGSAGATTTDGLVGSNSSNNLAGGPVAETCYIKISGMCPTTSYSDLRKYFAGLYIPHNGIKIVSGANGARTGIAYIEFSRVSSAQKALARNNTMFRDRLLQIVPIGDEEFEQVDEKSQRAANNRDGGTAATVAASAAAQPPLLVLYVEDLPQLTTEQDIMKMFSATCTIVDILLAPSPNNRREFVAFVLFARENEARSALEDNSRHYIGFRKLRVRASNQLEMQNAKDKMRRANEQLQKEEQQQREDAEREQQEQQLQLQQQQEQLLALQAKFSSDPRRRNNNEPPPQQQQHINTNSNSNNLPPFGNNMPFPFQQQQQQQPPNNMPNNGNNMHNNMHMNNNNMAPFAMNSNNNQQQQQLQQQHSPRQEDVFVRVHNCEYATRINDLGELFMSENLRIEHIEMLFNDRNQSAGEFIVEFSDAHNAKLATREFHNRRFRGRGLRLAPITPQEIADRMNKPFMNYLPGGNGPRLADKEAPMQQQQQQQQQQSSRRRGPSRFDDADNRNNNQQQTLPLPPSSSHESDDSNSSKQQHFNPFAARAVAAADELQMLPSAINPSPIAMNGGGDGPPAAVNEDGIPDKFIRPGCVVAMRNVPFKADLKDILRFFSDYKLSPEDILRRFNDEGKPTGDARVAFESQSEARSAFESRRRKQIFNRTIYLDII
ncbi:hypothetical protein KR044_007880 [Drosophila immigrans]|nr:hypothetical protein KR044_007880 [Drosophila immigrans]